MKKIAPYLFYIGGLSCLVGFVLKITMWQYAPFLVTIGATLMALAQLNTMYKGPNLSIKRLTRQQFFGTLLLLASGAAMLSLKDNEWIVLAIIAAFLYNYTAFRLHKEEKKENQ